MSNTNTPRTGVVIGIDVGGTKISGALFSMEGEIIHKKKLLLNGKGGTGAGSLVSDLVMELVRFAEDDCYYVDSVGICVPGISKRIDQTVWAPNIPGWEAYPLYQDIRDTLVKPSIPISIESDRNCYILGEIWKGSARGCNNAIFLAVGTGIGAGIVVNGQIINGMNGAAGAIGWMALDRPYVPDYAQCGHFEFHASGTGIARSAERMLREGAKSEVLTVGNISSREVILAYSKNDQVAVQVMEQCIQYWGMTVANLVSIFNPEKIIFGGGVFGPAVQFLERIAEEAWKWAQPISMQEVKLEGSSLKGETGMLGAAYLAIKNK